MASDRFSCTFSSGLIITDQSLLSTLTVFYDTVWLPYPFPKTPMFVHNLQDGKVVGGEFEPFKQWDDRWEPLYRAGALRRLEESALDMPDPQEFTETMMRALPALHPDPMLALARVPLLAHLLYAKKPGAEFHLSTIESSGQLMNTFFQIRLPRLTSLKESERILEVRQVIADGQAKQAMRFELAKYCDDFESHVRNGDPIDEAARKTVERNLLGYYDEFRDQLSRKGFKKFLDLGKPLLPIAVAPFSLEAWGKLVLAAGKLVAREDVTNKGRAFQYLARLEDKWGG